MKNLNNKFGRFSKAKNAPSMANLDIDELSKIGLDEPPLNPDQPNDLKPESKKTLQKRPKTSTSISKPLLVLLACLLLAALAYFLYALLVPPAGVAPTDATDAKNATQPATPSEPAVQSNAINNQSVSPAAPTDEAAKSAAMSFDPDSIPDPNEIINAELPANDSLAKEEIDRLNDEYARLTEQEKLAKQQADLMAELTQKKQEQIELLEKQIDQLQGAGSTNTTSPSTPSRSAN